MLEPHVRNPMKDDRIDAGTLQVRLVSATRILGGLFAPGVKGTLRGRVPYLLLQRCGNEPVPEESADKGQRGLFKVGRSTVGSALYIPGIPWRKR